MEMQCISFYLQLTHSFLLVLHSVSLMSISLQFLNFEHSWLAALKVENLQLEVVAHLTRHSSTEVTIIVEMPTLLIHFP